MRVFFGNTLIVLGLVLRIYVGFWLCFIGGIVQVIEALKQPEINAMSVALGIGRFFLSSVAGIVSAVILIFPGRVLLKL